MASLTPANLFVAALIATAGLWWFRTILPNIGQMRPVLRFGIYASLWLAYVVLVLIIIQQTGG